VRLEDGSPSAGNPSSAPAPEALYDAGAVDTLGTSHANSRDRLLVYCLCASLVALTLLALPIANVRLLRLPAMVPFQAGLIIAIDGITALLLFSQFRLLHLASLLILGATYLFSAAIALTQFLTFPGAVVAADRIPETSPWLWTVWHGGFVLWALGYLLVVSRGDAVVAHAGPATIAAVGAVLAAVAAVTAAFILGHERLPAFFSAGDRGYTTALWFRLLVVAELAFGIAVSGGLLWSRSRQTKLQLWLGLSLVASVCEVFCTAVLTERYTVYWYFARANMMVASCVVLSLLLFRISRLYRRLVAALTALTVANRTLESRVAERTAALAGSLAEKDKALVERDLLLREVYHRVKNNLQLVEAMMAMQSSRLEDAAAQDAFWATRRRLNALGLVHQQLMQAPDLATIRLDRFVAELCDTLTFATDVRERGIAVSLSAEPVAADLDFAIPFGLLFNELLSNAFKHAFPTGGGTVSVELYQRAGCGIDAVIQDDGTGGGVAPAARPDGTGRRIVSALVRQLGGEMSASVAAEGGTRVALRFPRDVRKAAA